MKKNLKKYKILGESYIVPIIFGANELSVKFSNMLIENGFYILPIRYPTVAKNTARLRVSLNSAMDFKDIDLLINCLNSI